MCTFVTACVRLWSLWCLFNTIIYIVTMFRFLSYFSPILYFSLFFILLRYIIHVSKGQLWNMYDLVLLKSKTYTNTFGRDTHALLNYTLFFYSIFILLFPISIHTYAIRIIFFLYHFFSHFCLCSIHKCSTFMHFYTTEYVFM